MVQREFPLRVERIQLMMDRKGWDIGILAYQSGVSYNMVYSILTQRRKAPSAAIVARLAAALGCSVDYLVGITDSPAPAEIHRLSEVQQRLLDEIGQLPAYRQHDLRAIVRALREHDASLLADRQLLRDQLVALAMDLGGADLQNAMLAFIRQHLGSLPSTQEGTDVTGSSAAADDDLSGEEDEG